jgi:hypothetical protein
VYSFEDILNVDSDSERPPLTSNILVATKLDSIADVLLHEQFNLAPDPRHWGHEISSDYHEFDDYLHNPDKVDSLGSIWTARGLANLGCITLLAVALIALFAGFPIISFALKKDESNLGGFNLGGINSTGQVSHHLILLYDPKSTTYMN